MNDQVKTRLIEIRKCMKKENINAYIIRSSDDHGSEYIGDHYKCREYISGFTGSAGTVVILENEAGLWTDGRYFLQAEQELRGSGITLYRMEEENVPDIETYLIQVLPQKARIGMDGKTISATDCEKLKKRLSQKQISMHFNYDFVGNIWKNRPKMSCEPVWELDVCYAGKTRSEKITELRKKMEEKNVESTVISALDDIAWILNVRGRDTACTPVVLSFLIVTKYRTFWFVQQEAVKKPLAETLGNDGIILRDYHEIYEFITEEIKKHSFYLDPNRTNMLLYQKVKKTGDKFKQKILEGMDLTLMQKAVKNPTEIENERLAHIKDGIACTKFLYWLKTSIKNNTEQITEISAGEKLEGFRLMQNHYLGPSFEMIMGYAEHGAIIHYHATSETDIVLRPENMLLVDSGGHYLEGTTDVTRTIALGKLTQEQKHHYTLVLKGNIRLASAKFKYGCAGICLDFLAREALAEEGYDYNHGTGHGVGYLLCVHEAPNGFRSKIGARGENQVKLEAGMITSNEPGLYFAGRYGIRLENLIVCKKLEKNEFGQFMGFETLTLVPFERDAILVEELTDKERKWLNAYHSKVRKMIGPYLTFEELAWLKEVTAEL